MAEVFKAFGFTGLGVFLGLLYARHGWKKYYEGERRSREADNSPRRIGIR